jgi:peptidoglycan DL-endopeptidase CwlO
MSSFFRASASLVVAFMAFGPPRSAWAASASAPSQSSLQAQADEISSQIQADARQLDVLDEQYNAAQIRYQQLSGQAAQLSVLMAGTNQAVAQARHVLKEQALLAYVAGGTSFTSYAPPQPMSDPTLRATYAEVIVGGEKQSITGFQATLARQAQEASELAAAQRQAAIALADVRSDQATASVTLAAQRQELTQVKGQLVALVAQANAARQKVEEAAIKASLASEDQPSPTTTIGRTASVAPLSTSPAPSPAITAPRAAPTTTDVSPPTTDSPAPISGGSPAPGADLAINYARAQLGKPYQWGGAGPNSFDCSGLTMMAWAQAGVYFPHLAQAQYDMTARVSIANLLPGDLVFYGTPSNVYHVGLYIGSGDMIDAPATGQVVSIQSIYWDGLLGGGRVSS